MRDSEFEQLEKLLNGSKLVDSKTFLVDEGFKNQLRNDLYINYVNNKTEGNSIMAKIKSISPIWKKATIGLTGMTIVLVAVLTIALLTNNKTPQQQQKDTLLSADLAFIEGKVEIMKSDSTTWEIATSGITLKQGDSIKTAENSKAIVNIDNGSALRLSSSTEVKLESMKPETIVVAQAYGQTYNRVEKSDTSTYTVIGQEVEAKALGTAYEFNSDNNNGVVTVATYESKVQVKAMTQEQDVNELSKAIINKTANTFEVKEMAEEEYKSVFAEWNKIKDQENGYDLNEKNAPQVSITDPSNGATTQTATITVKGKVTDDSALRKIVVNGKIYTSMDANGKGFNPADGTFNIDLSLKAGSNSIEIQAYDIYWNASAAAKIGVTYKTTTANETPDFYISSISSPAAGKIYVKWVVNGIDAPHGFKIVRDTATNPVYPGDEYNYQSNPATREVTWTGISAGTYYVRVCVYNGSGQCLKYTANKTVKVNGTEAKTPTDYADSVSLSAQALGGGSVKLTWNVTGGIAPNGFKVAWSTEANPTYPEDSWEYLSSPSANTYTVTSLTPGTTYHFRAGVYLGGSCAPYSNDASVTVL